MPGILSASNGQAVTEIICRTSPIWIGLHLQRQPLIPGAPLALTGPAGPSVPVIRDTGTAAGTRPRLPGQDRSAMWLRYAAAGLCALAAAAAVVSFTAQYRMVNATRHLPVVAALEAAIPDAAALVFACLGIALALRGRRALRARALNLAVLGGLILWLLRLALAPASTLAGFRAWVLEECPVAPGRRAARPAPPRAPARPGQGGETVPRKATKTARFLSLVTERSGPLASIPLDRVAQISAALAPAAGLNTGAARTALRKAVLAARNGDPR